MDEIKKVVKDMVFNRPSAWFGMVPAWVFDYSGQIGIEGVAIFAALCIHASQKEKRCFPSQSKLADELKCSEDTIARRIRTMEEVGLIKVLEKGNGRGHSTLYEIVDQLERAAVSAPSQLKGRSEQEKGPLGASERAAVSGTNISNKQIQEQSEKNPSIESHEIPSGLIALREKRKKVGCWEAVPI